MISSTLWQTNLEINIFCIHYTIIFLFISISFVYFLFKSARDKRNMNATGASLDLEDLIETCHGF